MVRVSEPAAQPALGPVARLPTAFLLIAAAAAWVATVAPANAAHLSTFGIDWGREGQSGFSAPFSWSG